jgi:threonine aldolase
MPVSRLVVLENTCNIGGGTFYTKAEIAPIAALCREKGLALHLDGARVFNALVESGDTAQDMGSLFDSISICLSKGLGAPVGSLLLGNQSFIRTARRVRKAMGGGMRQAGYLAAAGIYALDHHIDRLKVDNQKAKELGAALLSIPYVSQIRPVATNIVFFDVATPMTAPRFLELLAAKGIKATSFGPQTLRFVTHLDYSDEMHQEVLEVLASMK